MSDDESKLNHTATADWAGASKALKAERFCPKCERSFVEAFEYCPDDDVRLVVLGDEEDRFLGKTIRGAFTLRERLGKGGMGVVYTAWQHSVGREVAVKVMSSRITQDPEAAKRFFREAKLASRLSHPNIVTVHDFGQDEDRMLYIVMELLRGKTLRESIEDGERFDVPRTLLVAKQLCDALEAAHDDSIVHRDLKPGNIILLRKPGVRDFIKVLDFGIAKSLDGKHTSLTRSGAILGTPAYLPPEVALDGESDARSDLYSLGVILYQLLAGELPFVADDMRTMIAMHASEPVPPLPQSVPEHVAAAIYRMMAKDPKDRFQSATDVRTALLGTDTPIEVDTGDISSAVSVDTQRTAETREIRKPHGVATATTQLNTPGAEPAPAAPLAEPPARSRLPRALLAVGVALAGVAAVWFLVRGGGETSRDDGPAVAAGPVDAAPPQPRGAVVDAGAVVSATADSAPAQPEQSKITVDAPRGAVVFVDGRKAGTGRTVVDVPRGDRTVRVVVQRRGYRTWRTKVSAAADRVLTPTWRRRWQRPPNTGRRHKKPDAGVPKDDPWLD